MTFCFHFGISILEFFLCLIHFMSFYNTILYSHVPRAITTKHAQTQTYSSGKRLYLFIYIIELLKLYSRAYYIANIAITMANNCVPLYFYQTHTHCSKLISNYCLTRLSYICSGMYGFRHSKTSPM